MATILWDKSIDKHVDWAGDSSTNGQPVSGKYVQEFIKNTLEQKFGYIYHDQNLSKYFVFADEENFSIWYGDRVEYDNLKLAEFEAPAPASIEIINKSADSVTTLLNSTGNRIFFDFIVLDKSESIISDTISARFTFAGANDVKTYTTNIVPDTVISDTEANVPNWQNANIGTHFELNIDQYIANEGKYTITVTLSGFNSGATRTITFFYNVINLNFELTFDNTKPLSMNVGRYMDEFSFVCTGAGSTQKIIELYVDNNLLYTGEIGISNNINNVIPLDNRLNGLESNDQIKWPEDLKQVDAEGKETEELSPLAGKVIFSEGKHSLQARVSIPGSEGLDSKFWSKTRYVDFIVVDETAPKDEAFILYKTEGAPGTISTSSNTIELPETTQYKFISFDVIGIRLNGGRIPIVYEISDGEEYSQTLNHTINNLETDHFVNSFDQTGTYTINIKEGINETTQLTATVVVSSFESYGEKIAEELTQHLLYKYSATNRSNSENNKDEWLNSSPTFGSIEQYKALVTFNNVLWNDKSGWDGKSLVLSNGATVTFDIDLFNQFNDNLGGLTFEIDFETFNVFDDDAVLMDYSDPEETSYIKFTATSAELMSNKREYLKTNFNSNVRNKIALSFNSTRDIDELGRSSGSGNPNLILMYVNGVLDRATRWGNGQAGSDDLTWRNSTKKDFTIGDPTGKAGIKIYNLRIFRTAYEPKHAFMNYVVDQGENIQAIMEKNHVEEDGKVSLDLVKAKVATMVMSTDYVVMNGAGKSNKKKENTQYDLQFYDPVDPNLNFYIRNAWMSRQGTSSMNYPTKNLRPYFNKNTISVKDKDYTHPFQIDGFKFNFNTEFWPITEYRGNETEAETYFDANGIPPYSVNKKEIVEFGKNAFHEVAKNKSNDYKKALAKRYAAHTEITGNKVELWASRDSNQTFFMLHGDDIDSQIDSIIDEVGSIYISAYRPLRRTGWEKGSDEYWLYLRQLRYSGVKIFERIDTLDADGNIVSSKYDAKSDKAKKLDKNIDYYGLGAYWRQWAEPAEENKASHYSGWTDRWTLKADYAESSMTHNGGIGHLWGMAMKNTTINGNYYMMTFSQGYNALTPDKPRVDDEFIDIRTSCDSKPVALFVRQPESMDADGNIIYTAPEFAGLYVIMTDKSSVELFGFKDIKDEKNKYIFIADASQEDDKTKIPAGQEHNKVQCWECLQNGNDLAQGTSVAFDTDEPLVLDEEGDIVTGQYDFTTKKLDDKYGYNIGEGRPIFVAFEPRWPEDGSERHKDEDLWFQGDVFGTETSDFETFWNWVYFTKPALNYMVDGSIEGYSLNPYVKFRSMDEAIAWHDSGKIVYIQYEDSGNIYYAAEGKTYKDNGKEIEFEFNPNILGQELYWLNENINYENVSKTLNSKSIREQWGGSDVFKVSIPGFDASNRFVDSDGNLDPESTEALPYYVDVYMYREGSRYKYTNSFGKVVEYAKSADIDPETDFMTDSRGRSYADKTFMEFFSETKYDHLDIYKVAAYYVYMMRFAAVDQVVKNTMTTTEDGQHWYFINYDNDTTLGVRNDAVLAYKWDITRDSYDKTINNYAYAGSKSVLWNNLSMDTDFMEIVKLVDAALHNTYLKAETVLWYLDERMCNSWCERLYNAQEQIKYLTTFKNDFQTVKFLDFVQGTRKSHRNWWVTRRWELYDAEWGTGDWGNSMLKYYQSLAGSATNPVEFLRITSASRYTYDMISNQTSVWGKFVIGTDETYVCISKYGQNGTSDPATIYGVNKAKILNFRPNCGTMQGKFQVAMAVSVPDEENPGKYRQTNWIKEKGSLMTKFLIGDGRSEVAIDSFDGLSDVTSLEEIDIRRCFNLKQLVLVNLSNLHRYRCAGSALTSFEPSKGALFYEVQLPTDLSVLKLDETIFTQQLPKDNVVYQGNDEFSDKLPYDLDEEGNFKLGSIYNESAYRYTKESKAIFDYTPTYKLRDITFNNVQGFDTLLFLQDLKAEILSRPGAQSNVKNTHVVLNNINWKNLTVDELIELRFGSNTFTFDEFTGDIFVVSDEWEDEAAGKHKTSITEPEYNKLIDAFGMEVFDVNNPLRITSGDAVYFQPDVNTKKVELNSYDSVIFSTISGLGAPVYRLIRGDKFVSKATVFSSENKKYGYAISAINNETGSVRNSYIIDDNNTSVQEAVYGLNVKRNASGALEITVNEKTNITAYQNVVLAVTVCEIINGEVDYRQEYIYDTQNNIYLGIIDKVVPTVNEISATIDEAVLRTEYDVVDEKEHTLVFNLGEATNTELLNLTYEFSNPDYKSFVTFEKYVYDYATNKVTIKFKGSIPENSINTNNIQFNFTFDTTIANKQNVLKVYNFKLSSKYATAADTKILLNESEIGELVSVEKPGNYVFKIVLGPNNYNVAIDSITIDNSFNAEDGTFGGQYARTNFSKTEVNTETNEFTISILNTTFTSFGLKTKVILEFTDKYNKNSFTKTFYFQATIIYPDIDRIRLDVQNYNDISAGYISGTNSVSHKLENDIFLLNGFSTTTSDTSKKLITGQDYIDVKLNVYPQVFKISAESDESFDPTVNYTLEFISETTSDIKKEKDNTSQVNLNNIRYEVRSDETGHGNNVLRIYLDPQGSISEIGDATISGKYRLIYDVDDDSTNSNDVMVTNDFELGIHYTLGSASTYMKLDPNEIYLVDTDSNFYLMQFDSSNELTLESTQIIILALNSGTKFAGYGYLALNGVERNCYFVGLFENRNNLLTDPINGSTIIKFYPSDAQMALPGKASERTKDTTLEEKAFKGVNDTDVWKELLSASANTDMYDESNFALIYKYFDGTKVRTYIPVQDELHVLFNNIQNINKFSNLVEFINQVLEDKGMEKYVSIADYERSVLLSTGPNRYTKLNNNDDNVDDVLALYNKEMIFICSNYHGLITGDSTNGQKIMGILIGTASDSTPLIAISPYTTPFTRQSFAIDNILPGYGLNSYNANNQALVNYLSIIPFIKVS